MTVRSDLLYALTTTAAGQLDLFTVPSGQRWLIKDVRGGRYASDGGGFYWLTISDGSSTYSLSPKNASATGELLWPDIWLVVPEDWTFGLFLPSGGVTTDFAISGAKLQL